MGKFINSVFRIRTQINNDNIHKYVNTYLTDKNKLPWDLKKPIGQWDVSKVTRMVYLFDGRHNFNEPLNDWDVSNVVYMTSMFKECFDFNQPLDKWNVSKVKRTDNMFGFCRNFNQPLNDWNVGNVVDMNNMFYGCETFNQSLNKWDVSKVLNMEAMFTSCSNFNKSFFNEELNRTWNVSNVAYMNRMFTHCTRFNQPLNDWNVGYVVNMHSMFKDCTSFNKPLNDWNVSRVTNMHSMFKDCTSFNQSLNNWDVSRVADMTLMFESCSNFNKPFFNEELNRTWNVSRVNLMSYMFDNCSNFNQPLNDWDIRNVEYMNYMFRNCVAFNQPLNNWFNHIRNLHIDNRRDIFLNCPVSEQFNTRPFRQTRPSVPTPRVDAIQIHKEATKIKYDKLNEFLSVKTGNSVIPNNLNYPNYINQSINTFINEIDEPEQTKTSQRNGLQKIMNERLNRVMYTDLRSNLKNAIFYCLNYVKLQSLIFKKIYVESFIKDCVQAYDGVNGMSCATGALERIVFSLLPACAVEDNPDCETIIDLIQGKGGDIISYIRDWYKLHKNLSSSSNDVPFPTDEDGRRANLRTYLLEKLPGQEELIDDKIENFANHIGYEDGDFNVSYGGRRRINKRKTMKRRISKRKTNKRKTNKRKTRKM